MPYASQADIVDLYGQNALVVADRDGDGVADAAAISRAMDLSSGEMDTYIGRRYSLPLPALTVSSAAHLTQLCEPHRVCRRLILVSYAAMGSVSRAA